MMRFAFLFFLALVCCLAVQGQQLPANPDPNKCYVRCVTPDVYKLETSRHFTYTHEEAEEYDHIIKLVVLKPGLSQWETTTSEDCTSLDPKDCQVLCYRTYPPTYDTIYEPVSDLGSPFFREIVQKVMTRKGGLASYEEIDCRLMDFSVIPISFVHGSVRFEDARFANKILENQLLDLLLDRPNLRVQINVHSDSHGGAFKSQKLSEERAQIIAGYIETRGVNFDRVIMSGLGDSQLKNKCAESGNCTKAEHRINNRIEFRVLDID